MPQTTSPIYTPTQPHGSEHWLPVRVARRLVERHGFPEARELALRQKAIHTTALRYGVRTRNTPYYVIYWDIVAVATGKVPEPARHIIARTAA